MKTHVPLDPITARQLASSAATRARALDELARSDRFHWSWVHVALTLAGGLWGWVMATFVASGPMLVGIAAGAAFVVAAGTYRETSRMKRRLDAVVVLLAAQPKA